MNFCNKCGSKLINNSCHNCSNSSNSNLKKKNNKYILIFILALLLIGSGIFIYGKSISKTPEQVTNDFYNSISNKDSDNLQKFLYCDNKDLEINKTNAEILIDYFNKNPYELSKLNNILNSKEDAIENYPLSVQEVSKKFLLFPVYKIAIKPSFIEFQSNFKNYKIKISDETYKGSAKVTKIGPLMPGEYDITAELSTPYLNKKENFDICTFYDNNSETKIFKDLKTIKIDSNIPNADLYVNNKNTGKKIKDVKNFGPIDSSSTIYAIAQKNNANVTSSKHLVGSSDEIYIDFSNQTYSNLSINKEQSTLIYNDSEENFKEELFNLLSNYSSGFANAVNYDNFSYISPYLKINSSIYEKQRNVISYFYNQNIEETFISTEILDYTFNNNTNTGEVTCREVYYINKNDNGPKREQFKYTYTFEKNINGKLVLTDIKN